MKHLLLPTIAAVLLVGCGESVPDIPLQIAVEQGNIEAVKQNLADGVDVNAKDKDGKTPFASCGSLGSQGCYRTAY